MRVCLWREAATEQFHVGDQIMVSEGETVELWIRAALDVLDKD